MDRWSFQLDNWQWLGARYSFPVSLSKKLPSIIFALVGNISYVDLIVGAVAIVGLLRKRNISGTLFPLK